MLADAGSERVGLCTVSKWQLGHTSVYYWKMFYYICGRAASQHEQASKSEKEVVLLIDNICLTVCKGGKFTKIKATHFHRPLLAGCSTGHKTPPTQINCSQRWFHGFQITQDHLKDEFA